MRVASKSAIEALVGAVPRAWSAPGSGRSGGDSRSCASHSAPAATTTNVAAAASHCPVDQPRDSRGRSSTTVRRARAALEEPAGPIRDAIPAQRSVGTGGSTSEAARVLTLAIAAIVSRHSTHESR